MSTDTIEKVETGTPVRKKRKARWNMDATLRDAALVQMAMVVADKKSSHAAVCKASALLLRAEAQNQRDEQRRKKRAPKKNIPVIRRGWPGTEDQQGEKLSVVGCQLSAESGQNEDVRCQKSEVNEQKLPRKKKRARRWNIKPEYRDAMVMRWTMILADPKASQTVKFAVLSLMMRAEAQNQKDEEYRKKNKNRSPQPIIVGFTQDFYGNNAHELAAARAAAEANADPGVEAKADSGVEAKADSGVAGAKEDRDSQPEACRSKGTTLLATCRTKEERELRPEVKQDAIRADRGSACGRFATGPPE